MTASPSTATSRLPVDLVTGFLGSGKTTLVNAVLRDPAFSGALVIVNEFGEVGLDHLLVSSAEDQVVLLDSGCLCCSASASLRDTLIDLFARRNTGRIAAFDRIIVETSGLADPGPLVATLLGDSALVPRCRLAQVLTLVDANLGADTLERHGEARRQVAFADRLLVSKVDIAAPESVRDLRERLNAVNGHAAVALWQRGDTPAPHFAALPDASQCRSAEVDRSLRGHVPDAIDGADPRQEAGGRHGSAFQQITTHVLRVPMPVDWATYARWTQQLSRRLGRRLLRCKGVLAIGDPSVPMVVQGVQGYFATPEPLTSWPGAPDGGFLVCIGESVPREELDAIVCAPHSLQPKVHDER